MVRAACGRLKILGLPLFLDLKLHDIPNTVAGAARARPRRWAWASSTFMPAAGPP